jgi:hypothetical protein
MTGHSGATLSFQTSAQQPPSGTAKNSGFIKYLATSVVFMRLSRQNLSLTVLFTGKVTT